MIVLLLRISAFRLAFCSFLSSLFSSSLFFSSSSSSSLSPSHLPSHSPPHLPPASPFFHSFFPSSFSLPRRRFSRAARPDGFRRGSTALRAGLLGLAVWPMLALSAGANHAAAGTAAAKSSASAPGSSPASISDCAEFAQRLPNLKRELCEAAQLQASGSRSVNGRALWLRDIKPPQPNLKVLVVGAIHGDEASSASVALHWIALAEKAPADPAQVIHWRFIPVLNPDGVLMRPPRRTNANGVDLNRNFPTPNWQRDAAAYWERRTGKDPRRWPGHKPVSEPETQFLQQQMQSFQPDLIVSIHAPYGVLDFDGPSVPPSRLGRLYLDQLGIFPGSLGHYGGVHKGVPVVTIELPNAMRTPLDAEMRQMWLDLLRWMGERMGERVGSRVGDGRAAPSSSALSATPATRQP
jgi:murein peptide amidase A